MLARLWRRSGPYVIVFGVIFLPVITALVVAAILVILGGGTR